MILAGTRYRTEEDAGAPALLDPADTCTEEQAASRARPRSARCCRMRVSPPWRRRGACWELGGILAHRRPSYVQSSAAASPAVHGSGSWAAIPASIMAWSRSATCLSGPCDSRAASVAASSNSRARSAIGTTVCTLMRAGAGFADSGKSEHLFTSCGDWRGPTPCPTPMPDTAAIFCRLKFRWQIDRIR